jgi:hypothetical protein
MLVRICCDFVATVALTRQLPLRSCVDWPTLLALALHERGIGVAIDIRSARCGQPPYRAIAAA